MASAIEQPRATDGSGADLSNTPATGGRATAVQSSGEGNSGGGGRVDGHGNPSSSPIVSPVSAATTPPYWTNSGSNKSHQRTASDLSDLPAGAITLRDNENLEDQDDRNNACWAKSVEIVDHTVVNGGATGIGAFVVYIIKVETLTGSYMNIRKRYSEFDVFRQRLILTFPNFEATIPALPPKGVISKFRPRFLEKRRAGLQYFLNCILLNPEFSGSPVLKDFLFD